MHPPNASLQPQDARTVWKTLEQLQAVMDKLSRRDLKILMVDLNVKVGGRQHQQRTCHGKTWSWCPEREWRATHWVLHLQRPGHWRHRVPAQADNMDITRWEDCESNRSHHHRKKVEEKLGGCQIQTRSRRSLGPSPGAGRPESQAESLKRPSRQAIPQIKCTQPERQSKGWGLQYRSKVSYHLSYCFSRDESRETRVSARENHWSIYFGINCKQLACEKTLNFYPPRTSSFAGNCITCRWNGANFSLQA